MKTYYLSKSTRKGKKFMLLVPELNHAYHFGASGYRDYTLINDKKSIYYEPNKSKRENIKKAYLTRHRNNPKGIHSPSTLSDMFLWSAPTLAGGIKRYERKYKVRVILD